MKTKTITLYSLSELSKEAQKKAHDQWISNNDYTWLSDCLNERLHEMLIENSIKDLNDTSKPGTTPTEVQYSLSYCQGDGMMFAGSFEWKDWTVRIKHAGHYYHSHSKETSFYDENGEEGAPEDVENEFETIYQKICKDLERYGYDWIAEEDSFERFEESCEANEYTFTSEGIMEN
ncbi:MAG: hypothetical protein V4509_01680 [Patescibacteria group bacterium]